MKYLFKNEKGQTVVIILLVMVVGLTIGLSIVNRSLSDIKISQETEQSQRAFSAAEAGLEKAIPSASSMTIPLNGALNNVNYTVEKKLYGGTISSPLGYELTDKSSVKQDDVAQINLEPASGNSDVQSLKIFWAKKNTSETTGYTTNPCTAPVASLEITQVNYNSAVTPAYTIYKSAYKACTNNGNDFVAADSEPSDSDYAYSKVIDIQNYQYAKIIRIRPLFNDTSLKIKVSAGTLPDQEILLTSKGEANGKVRAIEWRQPIKPALPAIFDYVLFNGSTNNPLSK